MRPSTKPLHKLCLNWLTNITRQVWNRFSTFDHVINRLGKIARVLGSKQHTPTQCLWEYPPPRNVMIVALPSPAFWTCLVFLRGLMYPCILLGEKRLSESEGSYPIDNITVTEWPSPSSRSPCLLMSNELTPKIVHSRYDWITLKGLSSSLSRALKSNEMIRSTDRCFLKSGG